MSTAAEDALYGLDWVRSRRLTAARAALAADNVTVLRCPTTTPDGDASR